MTDGLLERCGLSSVSLSHATIAFLFMYFSFCHVALVLLSKPQRFFCILDRGLLLCARVDFKDAFFSPDKLCCDWVLNTPHHNPSELHGSITSSSHRYELFMSALTTFCVLFAPPH